MRTLILGHSVCRRLSDYIQSGSDDRLQMVFKVVNLTSVEIRGHGGLELNHLTANKGSRLHAIFRQQKHPDIVFLQIGGNDFRLTDGEDAETFALKLLSLASLIRGRFQVHTVIIGSILPRFAASIRTKNVFNEAQAQAYGRGLKKSMRACFSTAARHPASWPGVDLLSFHFPMFMGVDECTYHPRVISDSTNQSEELLSALLQERCNRSIIECHSTLTNPLFLPPTLPCSPPHN